jgi:hypothetical protein
VITPEHVDDRHDDAAQVDDALDERQRIGDSGHLVVTAQFLHLLDVDAVSFISQMKRQQLKRVDDDGIERLHFPGRLLHVIPFSSVCFCRSGISKLLARLILSPVLGRGVVAIGTSGQLHKMSLMNYLFPRDN